MNRLLQFLLFLIVFIVLLFCYTEFATLRLDEAYRYLIDVSFNTGTGVANIVEKDDWVALLTTVVMLIGNFLNAFFWYDFIAFFVGNRDAMNSDFCREFMTSCDRNISNRTLYLLTFGFLVIGILFGVYLEGMTFLVALNYAVGLLTTTGSQTCKNEAINNVITGTYMLLGIPLFAFTMTRFIKSLPEARYERVDGRPDL
jgi:hypothetical protein